MARHQVARVLAVASATGFFLAAALLLSSYGSVARSAEAAPPDVAPLLSALWLTFTASMVAFGLVVAVTPRGSAPGARRMLILAACFPLVAGGIQLRFLGYSPPAAILIGIGILTFTAATVHPASRQSGAVVAA